MKVIAIGATGFIGRYVVTKLVEAGHEVAVLHRGKTPLPACKGVTEILGERSTISELRNEFRTWSPEIVVDMILSSARQARTTLEAFHGIARRVVASAVFCGLCEDACPVDALELTQDFELASYTREGGIWDRQMLEEGPRPIQYT